MKNLPGLKIVGFLTVVLTVALGVYAASQQKSSESPSDHPNLIVKFGWEGQTPDLSEPLKKLAPKRAVDIITHFQKDSNLYIVREYKDGVIINTYGTLKTCTEPTPSSTPAPTPAPTRTPASPAAEPSGTPMGAKTQTTGAVALSIGHGQEFFRELNAELRAERTGEKGEKKSEKKK
jgi:hypothetical protein